MKHKNLASERVRIGLNQTELSEKLGIDRKTLCQYESGQQPMKPDFLAAAADFFGCSTDYLLDRTPERMARSA